MDDDREQEINLDEVNDAADLAEIASRWVRLHAYRSDWRGICPFHNGRNANFIVYQSTRAGSTRMLWKCMSRDCGAGNAIQFLMKIAPLEFPHEFAAARYILGRPAEPERPRWTPPPVAQPPLEPLQLAAANYHDLLRLRIPVDTTAAQLWEQAGLTEDVQAHFRVGYGPPREWYAGKKDDGTWVTFRSPSLTIPVVAGGVVRTIRHRLLQPHAPNDKYRPERKGDGTHLFNGDGVEQATDVLVLGGEKKVMVAHGFGLHHIAHPVCATAGEGYWTGPDAEAALERLDNAERIYFLLDPDAATRRRAELAAKRLGRRGFVVRIPHKLDDWLVAAGEQLDPLMWIIRQLQEALPPGRHPAFQRTYRAR